MDVRQFAFLARQPSAALKNRSTFLGLPKRGLALLLANAMFWQPLLAQADGIVVSAPGTSLGQAANGVPIVNIAAPNASGLSHNQFKDYNVGQQGLILNNSTSNLQSTQLGGYIIGNSNLQGRAANVILNEVNGGSPSQLKGYTEVAGQSAHVIVANPYGITCNGCGFINTPQATLTTGKAVIENGQINRYQVDQGRVSIEGAGLNATNIDRFEIITRSAKLNAEIQAKNLTIIAGANDVDAKTLKATARVADSATAPQLAIDSSALGGMYAGAIKLVGTESGVGVKLSGDMVASAGDLQLDINGKLTLAHTEATLGDAKIKAEDVALTESVYAEKNAQVVTTSNLEISKNLTAGGDVHLEGARILNQGNINSGLKKDGGTDATSHVHIQGGNLINQGKIIAQGDLSTDLKSLDNRNGEMAIAGQATLKSDTFDNRGGKLIGQQTLSLNGESLDNRGGTIASNQALDVTLSANLDNRDKGLILSKGDGLILSANSLDNRDGTFQANTGELKATAKEVFDNTGGKILTGAGAITLAADELRNQQGRINAQGGKLAGTVSSLDNSQGDIRADSVDVTAATRLNNTLGHIVSTAGDLTLKRGEIHNEGGEIIARQHLIVDADALVNRNGGLGGESIDLSFAGKLDNDEGLIESQQTLKLATGSLSNLNGKLRALGATGTSQFTVGGSFNNDQGLVEIGNAAFVLGSAGLSNQQGVVRHLGTQGFDLSLKDTGSAGGSFFTNSHLNLDLADWSNTSLIQAQQIGLKVGTFTQTANGKLVSVEGVEASGANWINDGSLETQGDLKLALSGSYQGSGSLRSQGRMTFAAASANLGEGAQVRSGGKADFTLSSQLINQGSLTATGDLLLQVTSLINEGTVGAGKALRIETPTLVNEGGLIFSGADMAFQTSSVTNNKGDVYSLGRLDVTDIGGQPASLIENISGTIESAHGMQLLASRLINRKENLKFIPALTSGLITLQGTDNCKGKHCEAYYSVTETYGTQVTEDSARANLVSGAELVFKGDSFDNQFSSVSARGDITLDTKTLNNLGAGGGEQHNYSYGIYTKDEGAYYTFINNIGAYNAYNNPASASYNPKAMPFAAIALGNLTGYSKVLTSNAVEGSAAIIQSAGQVTVTGTENGTNGFIRPGESIADGVSRVGATAVDNTAEALAQFNAQLKPDLSQKAVNPLSLPGFSLPDAPKGLFQFSKDAQHKYLIETNPAFASLNGFVNSDYLLSRIGVDPDQTQRRLGDGLYEQRLVREAVVARTGQRFIAGLDSDEAMFRYLMDNAIASKTELNLAPGIALSSAQVAALTHDIVWMEEQEVRGEKVLVPVLYLAQANNRLAPNGALIQGRDLNLISGGTLANQGTLRASNNLQVSARNIGNSGLMEANDRLSLLATESIRNAQGGILKGKDVSLTATQGNIINERSKVSQDTRYGGGVQHNDLLDNAARIEADNALVLTAGNDIRNTGSVLQAGGDATFKAGRDLNITSTEQVNVSEGRRKKTSWSQSQTTQYASDVTVGGKLDASAGRDLSVVASNVRAKQDLALSAARDVSIESAANESHNRSSSKKVKSSNDQVRQQSSTVQAGSNLSIKAGQDLTLLASNVKAGQNVELSADRDTSILSATNEDASFYSKKSKGSFGRSKSEQREAYDSTNVASVVEAGRDLTINASKKADGGVNIEGGRDVTVIGSRLKAGDDMVVAATGDIAVLSGVEEHGSYSKKTKSGFLGLSKSGKSQLKTTASQVGSELEAGNDVVVAAGNDIRLRASEINAENDAELRAGLVKDTGDINLVSANDTAYSRSEKYEKKTGSISGGFIAISSAKKAGQEAQSSTSVGSQVMAYRDATLQAERDINLVGSGINAGRDVSLNAGRDVNVVAAQNSKSEREWAKSKQTGIGVSSDANGVTFFAGTDRNAEKNRLEQQTAAASQIKAGENLAITAKRDINQRGSDLAADNDIDLKAGRNINIDAARERLLIEQQIEEERNGISASLNHNYGSTKDAVSGAGKGEDNVSKGSSALQGVDAVGHFLAGPTGDLKIGNSSQNTSTQSIEETNRSSTLKAGKDLNLTANNDVTVAGSQLNAGRDINVTGRDINLDVAKGAIKQDDTQSQSWAGIHGGTSGGLKLGVGGSHGVANEESNHATSTTTVVDAGRDVNLRASNDLNLIGTQVRSGRDIALQAGNDLNVRAAQNDSDSESSRNSGGGEAGLTFGSQGAGVYVSVSMGKGDLEREKQGQQNAYLYAGDRLDFKSGRDTNIAGAELRGDEVIGRVGRDLNVSSVPDTGKVKGKEFDISATVTIGPGGGVSGSVGYGQTTGKTNWVEDQTRVTARDKVDIRTEKHTQLDGALIASDTGNLKLDTGTLGFKDIAGKDNEHGYYLNVGGTYKTGDSTTQDPSQEGKGKAGDKGWSVSGWKYDKEREQSVRATVGSGEIIVRDAVDASSAVAGLNRDVNKASVTTKDKETRTNLYLTDSSLTAVTNPSATIAQWKADAKKYGDRTEETINKLVELYRAGIVLARGIDPESLSAVLTERALVRQVGSRSSEDRAAAISTLLGYAPGKILPPENQALVDKLTEIAGDDPSKALNLMGLLMSLNKPETGVKNFVAVPMAAQAVVVAVGAVLVASDATVQEKTRIAANALIEEGAKAGTEANKQIRISIAFWELLLGTQFPAHQLDPKNLAYITPIIESVAGHPSSGGFSDGTAINPTPHTGGTQLDGQRDDGKYVTPEHRLDPGSMYSEESSGTKATGGAVELTFDKATRTWTTPAGLDYGQGSVQGNRVLHVLEHAEPNPAKTTHSVFSMDRKEILGAVDEAWLKKGSPVVGDPGAYVVPMGRAIGTSGETSIKIIVRPGTSQVITAYPVK